DVKQAGAEVGGEKIVVVVVDRQVVESLAGRSRKLELGDLPQGRRRRSRGGNANRTVTRDRPNPPHHCDDKETPDPLHPSPRPWPPSRPDTARDMAGCNSQRTCVFSSRLGPV